MGSTMSDGITGAAVEGLNDDRQFGEFVMALDNRLP
jgi:hypothetical protein